MQTEKMGEKQVFLVAGIGLILGQLMLSYLGLGSRGLIKSFFWFLKNRNKLSLYLCIIGVLVCRGLYGQLADIKWCTQSYQLVLFFALAGFAWRIRSGFDETWRFVANTQMQKVLSPSVCTRDPQPAVKYLVC